MLHLAYKLLVLWVLTNLSLFFIVTVVQGSMFYLGLLILFPACCSTVFIYVNLKGMLSAEPSVQRPGVGLKVARYISVLSYLAFSVFAAQKMMMTMAWFAVLLMCLSFSIILVTPDNGRDKHLRRIFGTVKLNGTSEDIKCT